MSPFKIWMIDPEVFTLRKNKMSAEQSGFYKFSHSENLMPQEEKLEIQSGCASLTIGLPKEISKTESRICLAPEAVKMLVENGHRVIVEKDAAESARFTNHQYAEAGADIVEHAREVFVADIILKVAPLTIKETAVVKDRQVIFSALHLSNQSKSFFKSLISKKVTAIAFENIKDKSGAYPVTRSMSEIVGNASILLAADYLSNPEYGKGEMLGGFPGIRPTEIVIIGAGTVAENAVRTALGMGAFVKVFDRSIYKLERIQRNLNHRLFTSVLQPKLLESALQTADVVIAAMHSANGRAPFVISEGMVQKMKSGSIIIDVSIDQGGCVETSEITNHLNPVFKKHGVTHYCVPNIASIVPHTASFAFSNFFTPILLKIGEAGGLEKYLMQDYGFCKGIYLLNGIVTNKQVGKNFNLPYQDLDLLMAAFG